MFRHLSQIHSYYFYEYLTWGFRGSKRIQFGLASSVFRSIHNLRHIINLSRRANCTIILMIMVFSVATLTSHSNFMWFFGGIFVATTTTTSVLDFCFICLFLLQVKGTTNVPLIFYFTCDITIPKYWVCVDINESIKWNSS